MNFETPTSDKEGETRRGLELNNDITALEGAVAEIGKKVAESHEGLTGQEGEDRSKRLREIAERIGEIYYPRTEFKNEGISLGAKDYENPLMKDHMKKTRGDC